MTEITEEEKPQDIDEVGQHFVTLITDMRNTFKGLPKEEMLKKVDNFRFCVIFEWLRTNVTGLFIDGTLKDLTEEKIVNLLGNQNIHARKNDLDGLYEVYMNIKGGIVIIRDRHAGCALLRSLHFRNTSTWSLFDGVESIYIQKWKELNNISDNPLQASEEEIDELSKKVGVDISSLEQDIEDEAKRRGEEYEKFFKENNIPMMPEPTQTH